MTTQIRSTETDGVASIVLVRPECRNALSKQLLNELSEALRQATKRGSHAVVISGDRSVFSAGADLRELEGTSRDALFDDQVTRVVDVIRSTPMPVIAAIEGACIGAALDLALACDLRIVAEGAFLELPAIRMGLLYNPSALARIAGQVPSATVARLVLSGDRISGKDALAAGLATHSADDGNAVGRAHEIGARFRSVPTRAVESTKRFLSALATSTKNVDEWERERMNLLSSRARREAVDRARKSPRS